MKILKIVGIVLLSLVVILGVVIVMQPAQGHIEKSIVINAPPAVGSGRFHSAPVRSSPIEL